MADDSRFPIVILGLQEGLRRGHALELLFFVLARRILDPPASPARKQGRIGAEDGWCGP
jgi:hypothetical protein